MDTLQFNIMSKNNNHAIITPHDIISNFLKESWLISLLLWGKVNTDYMLNQKQNDSYTGCDWENWEVLNMKLYILSC